MQNSYMNTTKPTYSPINYEGRTGLFNGVTSISSSTPTSHLKNSLFLRNKLTPLRSPPLYNLSEISNTNNRSPKPVQNASGPLLASTRFNVSLGTYSDTKSPGLTNRIVQYSNEAKLKQTPTHQAKYGSPGLFPVVHFFKKDVPTISPQPRKVTVKIASPDTSWYNSPEFGAKKIAGRSIIAQNDHNASQMTTETETRSVLDALKEISRKRIHMSPDLEMEQDVCKRQKRSDKVVTTSDNNKRGREEDSPILDSQSKSVIQQTAKKICVVDMLAASYTSSQLYKEQLQKGLQKKTELAKADKHAAKRDKLLNVGTQTKESRLSEGDMEYAESHPKPLLRTVQLRKPKPKKTVEAEPRRNAFIFDEARLEINRKNRLATFLSALTGEEPVYWKYEKPKSSEIEGETVVTTPTTSSPPKLISILSPSNKPKHDKHVTFNLPPENNGNGVVATSISICADITDQIPVVSTPTKDNPSLSIALGNSETPKSILAAPSVTKLNFGEANSNTIIKETTISVNPIIATSTESKMEEVQPLQFGFTVPATQVTTTSTLDVSPFAIGKEIATSPSSVSSLVSNASSGTSNAVTTSPSSSTTGGFKFDLMKSPSEITPSIASSTTSLSQNKPAFGFMDSKLIQAPMLSGFGKPESTIVNKAALDFGANKPNSIVNNPVAITSATMFGVPTITDAKFNSSTSANQTNPIFQQSIASNNFGSNSFSFPRSPNATTTNAFGMQPPGQSTSSAFGTQVSSLITASTNNPQVNAQLKTAFGTAAPIISMAGFGTTASSNVPGFGTTATSSNAPGFGTAPTSSSTPAFGTAVTSSSTPAFGIAVTSSSTPAFGTSVTSSTPTMFGNVTTSSNTPGFGAQIVTSSNTPAFGTSMTSSNAPNAFGTTITNTNPAAFGIGTASSTNVSGFGASSTAPAFGFSTAPTTSAFAFGATNTTSSAAIPAFGTATTTSSMFGTPTTSTSFAPSSSGFGTNTTGSAVFGAPISTIPTTSSGFPSTNPAAPIFNTTTTSSGIFENKNENKPFAFGSGQNNLTPSKPPFNFSASTTSSTTGFSNKPAVPSFGSAYPNSNLFGTVTGNQQSATTTTAATAIFKSPSTTSFGATSNQFGSKPENTFGTKTENVFGAKSENAFGSVNNSFGVASNTPNFGANNSNTNTFGGNAGGTFGSNTNVSGFGPNSSNASGFGTNSGGFGTGSNNPNGFGGANSTNTGGFGMNTSNNNAFPVTPVSSSGFGAGSNTNNTFGTNSNTSAFGSGANNNNNNTTFGSGNVFGNTNPNPPAFGFNTADNTSAFVKSPPPSGVFGNPATADTNFQFNNNSTNQAGFGNTTNATPGAQGGVFAFGSSNQAPAPSAGIFTFGSNESKPAFNFNPGSNPTQGFGVGASNFNTGAAPGFNPPTQFTGVAGVFSIGSSGSTPGSRSRAQLKPKRRT